MQSWQLRFSQVDILWNAPWDRGMGWTEGHTRKVDIPWNVPQSHGTVGWDGHFTAFLDTCATTRRWISCALCLNLVPVLRPSEIEYVVIVFSGKSEFFVLLCTCAWYSLSLHALKIHLLLIEFIHFHITKLVAINLTVKGPRLWNYTCD